MLFFIQKKYDEIEDSIAIEDGHKALTYQELSRQVDILTNRLQKLGVGSHDRVAICLKNSIEFIVGMLAAIKLGAIYVPMGINHPAQRMISIIENCEPKVIITSQKVYGRIIPNLDPKRNSFLLVDDAQTCVSPQNWVEIRGENAHLTSSFVANTALTCIIYTSGSTGSPKGVVIKKESLDNFVKSTIDTYKLDKNSVFLCIFPMYYDASYFCFAVLSAGGKIVLFHQELISPRRLIQILEEKQITHLICTPSLLKKVSLFLDESSQKKLKLKYLGIGGEKCPYHQVKKVFELLPDVKIFNRYGPTETTGIVCGHKIEESDFHGDQHEKIPIGKPIPNVKFYVFNDRNEPAKPFEVGELYISGISLMYGYWKDQELTKSVFHDQLIAGEILYRTGDYVYYDEEGKYFFVSRKDDLIKRKGYRIYLSEIDRSWKKVNGVVDAASVYWNENDAIVSFLVVQDEKSEIELRSKLANSLPTYMMPDSIELIDSLPLNEVGKINRQALLAYLNEKRRKVPTARKL